MTKQERELLESCQDAYVRLDYHDKEITRRDECIRRLIKHGEEDLWSAANANGHDTSAWDAVKADAERLLEGRG